MRLSVEWIKEYAPVEASAEEIADQLTMAGLEVEETAESEIGPVLDIKVTPNRGDCLSVVGVARELASRYRIPLKPVISTLSAGAGDTEQYTSVTIDAPDLCPRYAARIVRNVRVGESPTWMQRRLIAAGMRPINNIVDVTNYVMLEMGQPLHAFDYDTLNERRIVVRRAREGETLRTLDGAERTLTPDMLAICDSVRPVAIAGVMGGAETEITASTTTMLLETAHFHSRSIRATARALGLHSDASYRFERVVDPALVVAASDRACALIAELGIGEVLPGVVDAYPMPETSRMLSVCPERVGDLLGFPVSESEISDCLTRLGFLAHPSSVTFQVPSWRPDIVREVDLIEEVGRVIGYERIPERLPTGATTQGRDSQWGSFAGCVRAVLTGAGLQEIVSHSLTEPNPYEDSREDNRRIAIRSALSEELSGLRRSLLPGLVKAIRNNARRGNAPLAFFEIGRVFYRLDAGYCETARVEGALTGPFGPAAWQKQGQPSPADYYTARGLVERLAGSLGIDSLRFERRDAGDTRLHPGRAADIWLGSRQIGYVGELHPRLTEDLNVRDRVVIFSLACDALQAAAVSGLRYVPVSPFPAVQRDLAPRLREEVSYSQVQQAMRDANITFLERFELTDVYTGAGVPEGMKSLTLSLAFRAADRTLTDAEVNEALDRLRAGLVAQCGAVFVG